MFCQGITPEPVDELVVRKPKASGSVGVQSTLYRAYGGNVQILKHIKIDKTERHDHFL